MYAVDRLSPDTLAKLPTPTGFHLLIATPEVKQATAGGVILPDGHRDREGTAAILGLVLAVGPDAYSDTSRFPNGPWCKEGDWVIFRSYSGTRVKYGKQEFRLINDDTVEAIVADPVGWSRA